MDRVNQKCLIHTKFASIHIKWHWYYTQGNTKQNKIKKVLRKQQNKKNQQQKSNLVITSQKNPNLKKIQQINLKIQEFNMVQKNIT